MTAERTGTFPDLDLVAICSDPSRMLPQQLCTRARSEPDRDFLTEVTGRRETFGSTWELVRRWIGWLHSHGVRPGDHVATLLPSSIDAALAWVALSCLGAIEVPINPELTGEFLEHVLDDAAPVLCLARPELAEIVSTCRPSIRVIVVERDMAAVRAAAPLDPDRLPGPADISCVIYTSGTTGPAKGVVLRWAQFAAVIGRAPLVESDVAYACNPMFHVTGRTPIVTMCDLGGRIVFRERFSLGAALEDVRRFGCTTGTMPAGLLLTLPSHRDDADVPLRWVFTGHNTELNEAFRERFQAPGYDCYGSTEVGFPLVRWKPPKDLDHPWCGRLRPGYEAKIVDDAGREVPDGDPGELWIKAGTRLMLMDSYLNRPDATEKAFEGDWYRTGDILVRESDGEFRFVDRARDTIRRMGENISSTAVEAVVVKHPSVVASAVVGVPDRIAGHEVMVVAERKPGVFLSEAELYEWISTRIPRYALPRFVLFVDALDRTPTGKVRKTDLPSESDIRRAWRRPDRR